MSSSTLAKLAHLVNGSFHGDGNLHITGAATLPAATDGDISFAESADFEEMIASSDAAAVVVPREMQPKNRPYIQVANVRGAFIEIVRQFRPPRRRSQSGISAAAHVSPSSRIADDAIVYPGVVIGDDVCIGPACIIHPNVTIQAGCRLADHVEVFPNAVLYEDSVIGPRCIIHAGAVIGAYGFGYDMQGGRHHLSPQLGFVRLEADVEIGACSTVDRGTYGATVIGEGTKVDNQVQIAHNCRIGRHNVLCSQVGIAGSSTTGDYVVMAGQVGVPDHVCVGDRAVLGAKAGIMRDVPHDTTVLGIPATPERDQLAKQAAFAKLPEMRKQLRALQKEVQRLALATYGQSDAA